MSATDCPLCEAGFPLEHGFHYGTQKLGMIPTKPCLGGPERCGICGEANEPGSPASGEVEKTWLCVECVNDRAAYMARNGGTSLDSMGWAARRSRSKAFEEAAKICEKWVAYYPPDVFPAHGETTAAKSGTFGRHVAGKIAEDIREAARGPS